MTALAPPPAITHSPEAEAAVVRKVMWRLIPFLVLLYLMNYIDRVNVGIAKLQMPGINESVYGYGVATFFISYLIFEIPSNLIQEKVGPRRWIARIMVSWGIISTCFLFVRGPWSFYILRFLLGVAEAGFFPGIILYLSYWIPAKQRARASAMFLTSMALSGVIGNPLGGFILYLTSDAGGLQGWQWLFLLEGISTVLLGFTVLFFLTDHPADARWLSADERAILTARMAHERHGHPTSHTSELRHAFTNPMVWLLSGLYGLTATGFYLINYWTPTIAKRALIFSGDIVEKATPGTAATPEHMVYLKTGLVAAIPFTAAAIGMVIIAWNSDRTGERRWHTAISIFAGTVGLGVAALSIQFLQGYQSLVTTMTGLSVAAIGIWGSLGPFWTMPPRLLSGTAAAAGIALVNAIGNFIGGGFVQWGIGLIKKTTTSDLPALIIAATACLVAALVFAFVKVDQPWPARTGSERPVEPPAPDAGK
jgi:MFS transporter, ACS family, tartrate transporter